MTWRFIRRKGVGHRRWRPAPRAPPDFLIDDAVKSREEAFSEAERRSLRQWYEHIAYSRLEPWRDTKTMVFRHGGQTR
jgi:hypothetical protein